MKKSLLQQVCGDKSHDRFSKGKRLPAIGCCSEKRRVLLTQWWLQTHISSMYLIRRQENLVSGNGFKENQTEETRALDLQKKHRLPQPKTCDAAGNVVKVKVPLLQWPPGVPGTLAGLLHQIWFFAHSKSLSL
jgi:hypothetical protein